MERERERERELRKSVLSERLDDDDDICIYIDRLIERKRHERFPRRTRRMTGQQFCWRCEPLNHLQRWFFFLAVKNCAEPVALFVWVNNERMVTDYPNNSFHIYTSLIASRSGKLRDCCWSVLKSRNALPTHSNHWQLQRLTMENVTDKEMSKG